MANVTPARGWCSVSGCGKPARALGLCWAHWWPTVERAACEIEGCDAPQKSRGWCNKHYLRWRRFGDPLLARDPRPKPKPPPRLCDVEGCERIHYGRGLCKRHYMQLPDRQRMQAQYEKQRRAEDARREAERARNRERRAYISAWLRTRPYGRDLSTTRRTEIFRRDEYRCQVCGRQTGGEWPEPESATIDHIIPLSRGGAHTDDNLQCACWGCNLRKGARLEYAIGRCK